MIRKKIGQKIKELREEKNLTQYELSQKAGVGLRTVSNIELGAFNARLDTLQKIASALDCTVDIISI